MVAGIGMHSLDVGGCGSGRGVVAVYVVRPFRDHFSVE